MNGHTLFETDLGDASSWCDSACERCPLLGQCPVGQAVSRRLHRMQLDDGPEVLVADLTRDVNRALLLLENVCESDGIDLDTIEVPPIPPLVTAAETLGADLVRAAVALTDAAIRTGRIDQALTSRLVGNATLIAVKTVRVAWSLGDPGGPTDPLDAVEPILLLLERTSAEVRRAGRALTPLVPPMLAARFAATHGAMIDFVTPWIAKISERARAELNARIAAGCAPSPFCYSMSEPPPC